MIIMLIMFSFMISFVESQSTIRCGGFVQISSEMAKYVFNYYYQEKYV